MGCLLGYGGLRLSIYFSASVEFQLYNLLSSLDSWASLYFSLNFLRRFLGNLEDSKLNSKFCIVPIFRSLGEFCATSDSRYKNSFSGLEYRSKPCLSNANTWSCGIFGFGLQFIQVLS